MTPQIHIRDNNRGFALISTISIMALLLILAMSMLSLSTITVRDESVRFAQSEAQDNARQALMLAIGQLQSQLGPDQRISITADQRSDPSGDGSVTNSALGNRHWTGVYNSWAASSDSRPAPEFRSWLISGDNSKTSLLSISETVLSVSESVELVGTGTLGLGVNDPVRVPTVDLMKDSEVIGRMAWWVGDQGVKAAINTESPSGEGTIGVTRNNLQSAPRNAAELASYEDATTSDVINPFVDLDADDPRLSRVISWQQSAHLVTDISSPRPLFHDLSAFSSGLMTNVRDGGFRKDLSMKMETYTTAPDLSDPENVLYTVKSDMTGNDEVGVNFMELWSYYHLYKELNYGGGLSYTTGGSVPSNAPYLQTKNTQEELNTDPWDRLKHPITINYQTVYSFEADPHPDEPGKYILWLNFDPVVTLWNPLDVAVDVSKHARWNYLYSFWMIPYDIKVSVKHSFSDIILNEFDMWLTLFCELKTFEVNL